MSIGLEYRIVFLCDTPGCATKACEPDEAIKIDRFWNRLVKKGWAEVGVRNFCPACKKAARDEEMLLELAR